MREVRTRAAAAIAVVLALAGCTAVGPDPSPTPSALEVYPPQLAIEGFETSGYVPQPVAVLPYVDRGMDYTVPDSILDLNDPAYHLDSHGVVMYLDVSTGEYEYNPVQVAQYGLAALGAYQRTGTAEFLTRALASGDRMLALGELRDGTMWFPYDFAYTYYDVTMTAPWWSGMAQGQALSLFVRLAEIDATDAAWSTAAAQTFVSFNAVRKPGQPWASIIDSDNHLWFEEYAGDVEPLKVMNGDVFAIYGVYDYYMLTGDERARELFDGAATTILAALPVLRVPGGVSYYCARVHYCQDPRWQNPFYHPIHRDQLRMLAQMTGDPAFATWAQEYDSDFTYYGDRARSVRAR